MSAQTKALDFTLNQPDAHIISSDSEAIPGGHWSGTGAARA